jgi:large subunit ribosomal protein L29
MKANEFRNLSDEELRFKESDLRDELFKLKYQHSSGQLENAFRLKETRRNIARLLTVYRERILNKRNQAQEEK